MNRLRIRRGIAVLAAAAAMLAATGFGSTGGAQAATDPRPVQPFTGLSAPQRAELMSIARRSWTFYADDVDPRTHLPLDNITYAGGADRPTSYGRYTSSANIGVYLWALVSASDLGLISRHQATIQANQTLSTVRRLPRFKGFLFQWYDTSTGQAILNPGEAACSSDTGTLDNCSFVSNVDNGWYASGLTVLRQALPGARANADRLLAPMDFSIFYDARAETHCNTNAALPGNPPTGQMYGGYYAGSPPNTAANAAHYYHNGALYSDPRIGAYLGIGRHQMPGNVWWRTWRELPPKAPFADCQTDPDFSYQGQWPMQGRWVTITDPQSHQRFPVWEGHYTYPGTDLKFVPTFAGGMFEALMADQVVPETSWGPGSFGLADKRIVRVQARYARQQLKLPVWGMSPSSTADDSGGYGGYGVAGLTFPYYGPGATRAHPNRGLAQCHDCAQETVVSPHASFIALDAEPQLAFANINQLLRHFGDVYGSRGFYDAVDPATGAVGHRILVLDQSMIMAALDNALRDRALQRHFAADPVSQAAYTYLSAEQLSLR